MDVFIAFDNKFKALSLEAHTVKDLNGARVSGQEIMAFKYGHKFKASMMKC